MKLRRRPFKRGWTHLIRSYARLKHYRQRTAYVP
jgi:hypothetical protein